MIERVGADKHCVRGGCQHGCTKFLLVVRLHFSPQCLARALEERLMLDNGLETLDARRLGLWLSPSDFAPPRPTDEQGVVLPPITAAIADTSGRTGPDTFDQQL